MPLVSVLMPNLNGGKYIEESIRSILSQTFKDFELLIIDNGSTDDSLELISKFHDERIKLLHCKMRGARFALNMGIDKAQGAYVMRMDADDISRSDRIEKQVTVLNDSPEFGVSFTDGWVMNSAGVTTGQIRSRVLAGYSSEFDRGEVFNLLLRRNFIIGASLMVNQNLIQEVRFDETIHVADDWSFSLRLAKRTRFKYVEEPLYGYRLHEGATCSFGNIPYNIFQISMIMMKWGKTIHMPDADRRLMLLAPMTIPVRLLYAVVHRSLGQV